MTEFTTHTGQEVRRALWTALNAIHTATFDNRSPEVREAINALDHATAMARDFTMELDGLEVNTKIHKSVPDNVPPKKIRPS